MRLRSRELDRAFFRVVGRAVRALPVLVSILACRSPSKETPQAIEPSAPLSAAPGLSASSSASDASAPLPALQGSWLEPIELETGTAFVAPPVGAREPRPVIVAAHGAGDRAEWACGGWRLASRAYAFVVCPQGRPSGAQRFAWSSARALREAVEHALAGLRKRYGAYIAEPPWIYAGFSQGAILSRDALLAEPGRYSVAVFAEGGYGLLADPTFASAMKERGVARALVVCGGAPCFERARSARPGLQRAGLQVFLAGDARAGHNLNDRMQKALQAVWSDVVAGQSGWSAFSQ